MPQLTRFSEERQQEIEQELLNSNRHVYARNPQSSYIEESKDESDFASKEVKMIDNYEERQENFDN